MKVIVPLAGKGTRLLPLTKRVPKPLVQVAGRPVMDYVMDTVRGLDVEELIVITGHLKDVVEKYIVKHYDVPAKFVEQKTLDGTAGAIDLARPYVDGPVMIIFVDTLFDADLSVVKRTDRGGDQPGPSLRGWSGDDHLRGYAVRRRPVGREAQRRRRDPVGQGSRGLPAVRGHRDRRARLHDAHRGEAQHADLEARQHRAKLANIGLYYIKDWRTLFDGITEVMRSAPGKGGEFYLTDAFQYMVDHGKKLVVGEVTGWYDCGKVDTLLETNRHLLEQGRARRPKTAPKDVIIRDPVYIEDGVRLANSTIGPNVSLGAGSSVTGSTVANSILGKSVRIQGATVEASVVGDDQVIEGRTVQHSVLDGGERAAAR